MAIAIATGTSISPVKPVRKTTSTSSPSSKNGLITKETPNAETGTAPANASHFSCCRSTSRERRKRTASAASEQRKTNGARTAPLKSPNAAAGPTTASGTCAGLSRGEKVSSEVGSSALANTDTAATATEPQNTQRQRPGSGRPSGKICPISAGGTKTAGMKHHWLTHSAHSAAGSDWSRATATST